MVSLTSLWVPILVSAVFVFIASAIIHMVLPYHRNDFKKLPSEDGVMEALRKFNIPPGDYVFPHAGGPKDMKNPEFIEKWRKGPLAIMTVLKPGPPAMGGQLFQWFLFCALISIFAAYIASRALMPGADYLSVFRFAGTTAFAGYSLAYLPGAIWYKRSWAATTKNMFDGLVYGLLTAGTFGWLWPR